MNTNEIAEEYRLIHWAGIMRERQESGLSVKAFCKSAGFHENTYFYWQKKLREVTCEELVNIQREQIKLTPSGFAEVKITEQVALPPPAVTCQSQISIEAAGLKINTDSEYPIDKLSVLLREVMRL